MNKIKVHYVGGIVGNPNNKEMWGGTKSTNYIIKKIFEKSEKYDLVIKQRTEFQFVEDVYKFLQAGDISWVDETSILQTYFQAGYERPDLIGPISRSPVKRYNGNLWESIYTPNWFYSGEILRLNEAEEKESTLKEEYKGKGYNFLEKVNFIRHSVDIDLLKPSDKEKKYILWAGTKDRPAKNYPFFEEIIKEIQELGGLPNGYEFKVLSNYNIEDYYSILDETAILVNTSKCESFCCAVAEGMAKGVPTLVRKDFNGKYMFLDRPLQIEYTPKEYALKIMDLLKSEELNKLSKEARKYSEDNFSMEVMLNDIEKVLDKIFENKNEKKFCE